jgi:hypothetical protein
VWLLVLTRATQRNIPEETILELKSVVEDTILEIKSVVEMVKVLKEDQKQLSCRVDNIECSSVNMPNTVSKAGSNAVCLTDRITVSQYKRHAKINTNPHQQFKIPMVVNHFTVLDNLKEDNSVPQCQNFKLKLTVKKLKLKVQSATKKC